MSAGAALEPSASPRRPWSAACDRSSPSVGRAGRPSARSALRCTADPPPLPASRSASPRQYPERCAPSARAPDRRRSGSRCLAQSLCYPLPWWLLVSLALLNVSQRQLNQSGSHRPNLRKILYVIKLMLREPSKLVVACHCLACQRRTGSPFSVGAFYAIDTVEISGGATEFVHVGDSGNRVRIYFCPTCGSTIYWKPDALPSMIGVAVGALAAPDFPAPALSIFERSKHHWVQFDGEVEHF